VRTQAVESQSRADRLLMKRHRIYREERQLYWPAMETRQARERKAELARNDEDDIVEGWQGFETMFKDER